MSRFALPVLAAILLGISAPPVARADEPSVYTLAETARFDPHSPSLREIVRRLDEAGEPGWKALVSLALDLEHSESTLPALAAGILLAGDADERAAQAGRLYDNSKDEILRASLAVGLARAYPDGARRLHAHLRANRPGALDLMRALLPRGLPHGEVEAALEHPELASLARDHLEGRTPAAGTAADLPRARDRALDGLDAVLCRTFVAAQLAEPDLALLTGLAEVLREPDERKRVGAHCLLLSVSGLDMAPDAALWHAWIETHGSAPTPNAASRGAIAAAVTRGTLALRKYLQTRGPAYWPWAGRSVYDSASGGTALAVLALLASGVPADDEAVQGALQRTLFVYDRGGRAGLKPYSTRYETYALSLLAMAIRRLDPVAYGAPLVAIRDRLAAGILESGMWTYTCPLGTTGTRPERGDNSNTQYANLGLRALRGCGVTVERSLWERVDAHWRTSQFADGGWGYSLQGKDVRRGMLQMTASGVAGLAIAAEGLHESDAAGHIRADESVRRGLAYLGRCLFLAKRTTLENYAWYAVERACMLTGTRLFAAGDHSYDWYREGARHLLATQNADGSWGRKRPNKWLVEGYGLPVDTAFALLFLTRSTATSGDGANEGVVQVKLTAREREALAAARSTPPPRDEPAPTPPTEPVAEHAPEFDPTPAPAELDRTPPRITFVGSAIRHVGKQRLLVEADEVLDGVKVGRHYFPADGRRLWITVELTERHRSLTVFAYDLAGNKTRASGSSSNWRRLHRRPSSIPARITSAWSRSAAGAGVAGRTWP